MSMYCYEKTAAWRVKCLLAIAMALLFSGVSQAADTYEVLTNEALNPSTLSDGDLVVLWHNASNCLVGCTTAATGSDATEVSKSEKAVTAADADYYVFKVSKWGSLVALTNGAGYSPKISTTLNEDTWEYEFSFQWSNESSTDFKTSYSSAGTHLYVEKGGNAVHLLRADGKTSCGVTDDESCNWTFYKVEKYTVPTLTSPESPSTLELGIADKGETLTGTFHVQGVDLTSDLTLTLKQENGTEFSIDKTTITAAEALAGVDVKVTFSAAAYGEYSDYVTITGDGINTVVYLAAVAMNPEDQKPTSHGMLTSWTDNAGYQQVGYTGLGKARQVLAMALVNATSDGIPEINYRLFGHTEYISAIGVYARKRDTSKDYTPYSSVRYTQYENTFAHLFDYRNPERNCGAQFLGFTYAVPGAGNNTSLTSNVKLEAGEYVIYLVADIKTAAEIGGIDKLPLIAGSADNFTRIGGVINTVTCGDNTYTINTVNNYSADGGGRVIVPNFEMLYAPRYQKFATAEEYSKYYRIPVITKTADGTLVALSDARKNHIHDVTNNIDIVSRRSTDNGQTWSDYVVIFQGLADGTDCKNWKGYGDVAIASFPNGSVMATAINGFGLLGSSSDPASNVVWKVSRDNGKSWSSEYVMSQDMYGKLRGNISPGNMCVANAGYLKGKALAMLRTSTYPNNAASAANGTSRLYCLTYDPDDNEWVRVTVNGADYLENSAYVLDEAQFVQVGDNDYLLSVRTTNNGRRTFYRVSFTSETTATATLVTYSGMTLTSPTNGDAITYTAKDGTDYVIHTVPKDLIYASTSSRSSLSAYYAKASDTASGNIAWTRSLDLFDPFDDTAGGETRTGIGAFDETAQYSSISKQADGTIGVVMEAYPYAVNHYDYETNSYSNHGQDWVMGEYYINLRVGDLIPGAEPLDEVKIDAPVISPVSATYDSADPDERPKITISHQNYAKYADLYDTADNKVNTSYEFELYNTQNERVARSAVQTFQSATSTVAWADVWALLVKENTTDEHFTTDPTLNTKGYYLRVSAYCVADNNIDVVSGKSAAIYTFDTPVRKIMVVGVPTSGVSNIALAAQGQSIGSDEWLTVGTGKQVVINAPAKYPYKFDGFYLKYTGDESTSITLKSKVNYTTQSGMEHQITFSAPTADELADTYNSDGVSGIVIYAVYTVEAGFSTRVNTQYNNGKSADGKFESQYSYWTPSTDDEHCARIQSALGGDVYASDLSIPTSATQNNTPVGGNGHGTNGGLTYPQKLNYGLDAYVTILPDAATASNLNAVVRVKKDGEYLPQYYVVNSYNQPLTGDIVTAESGCLGRLYWYGFADGVLVPKAVGMKSYEVGSKAAAKRRSVVEGGAGAAWYKVDSDITFEGICAKGEEFSGDVAVEIFLVNNAVTSISHLNDARSYFAKVSHPIVMDTEISTGVTDIAAEQGKIVANVTYYNVLGVASPVAHEGVNVVVTTYTDGTKRSVKIVK